MCILSCFIRVQLFATLWAVVCQASLSMGFSRQGYWSGLPCLPPGDLPNPGIEPASLTSPALASGFFTTNITWEAQRVTYMHINETFLYSVKIQSLSSLFSCSVVSDSLRSHGLQNVRLPVHHQLLELTQTHDHRVSDVIQPSHPLSSLSPPVFSLSQHQGLFQWISSLRQVAQVLEFQL